MISGQWDFLSFLMSTITSLVLSVLRVRLLSSHHFTRLATSLLYAVSSPPVQCGIINELDGWCCPYGRWCTRMWMPRLCLHFFHMCAVWGGLLVDAVITCGAKNAFAYYKFSMHNIFALRKKKIHKETKKHGVEEWSKQTTLPWRTPCWASLTYWGTLDVILLVRVSRKIYWICPKQWL